MTRWRAFRGAEPGFDATVLGNQVHQTAVQFHASGKGWIQLEGLDGHATSTKGILLTVTVADCIPVYLLDPVKKAVALLHAGWRGIAGRILAQGVETLGEAVGSDPGDLVMHCGVGICGNCYEVGSEVMEGCGKAAEGSGPWHLDLRSVLAEQAGLLGIGSCRFPNGAPHTTPGTSIVTAGPAEPTGEWWLISGYRRSPSCG
jgi:Uncharacterized conserved protein